MLPKNRSPAQNAFTKYVGAVNEKAEKELGVMPRMTLKDKNKVNKEVKTVERETSGQVTPQTNPSPTRSPSPPIHVKYAEEFIIMTNLPSQYRKDKFTTKTEITGKKKREHKIPSIPVRSFPPLHLTSEKEFGVMTRMPLKERHERVPVQMKYAGNEAGDLKVTPILQTPAAPSVRNKTKQIFSDENRRPLTDETTPTIRKKKKLKFGDENRRPLTDETNANTELKNVEKETAEENPPRQMPPIMLKSLSLQSRLGRSPKHELSDGILVEQARSNKNRSNLLCSSHLFDENNVLDYFRILEKDFLAENVVCQVDKFAILRRNLPAKNLIAVQNDIPTGYDPKCYDLLKDVLIERFAPSLAERLRKIHDIVPEKTSPVEIQNHLCGCFGFSDSDPKIVNIKKEWLFAMLPPQISLSLRQLDEHDFDTLCIKAQHLYNDFTADKENTTTTPVDDLYSADDEHSTNESVSVKQLSLEVKKLEESLNALSAKMETIQNSCNANHGTGNVTRELTSYRPRYSNRDFSQRRGTVCHCVQYFQSRPMYYGRQGFRNHQSYLTSSAAQIPDFQGVGQWECRYHARYGGSALRCVPGCRYYRTSFWSLR